ncbi:uncharacterized protein LAESUDRAFT_697177 [Laetiporus sulphureus 93-53]|uniref:Cryptic loci regulator 2 N-terminal domain-containing protein n=1 Tax=Laetiporus sulphureus 93-53 TaxID=1314785 RepID=A0A165F3V8_9APHY|nr:uncharacterized protein LAESUDRAFT_697177 [Laetiporus sulphureus 93-53]KZT08329.1 hypothetical protein LAESUDRAFT_697177 [Laetiporus sulphureus 93-53]
MSGSWLIVKTPYYSAYQYSGGAVGVVLEPRATDADPHNIPPQTTREPDAEGKVWYYERENEENDKDWRKKLGEVIARQVVEQDVKRQRDQWSGNPKTSILFEFPVGYTLWVHYTQDRHVPRHDTYLYGSRTVNNFRSPAEFAEHLIWLMNGSAVDRDGNTLCRCVYCCPGRTQEEISAELGVRRPSDKKEKRRSGQEEGSGSRPAGRRRKSTVVTTIPAKDYTKLNTNPST